MTEEPTDTPTLHRATPDERRATAVGAVLVVLAALVLWLFGFGVESSDVSTFNLSLPGAKFEDIQWKVDSQWLSIIVAGIIAFLGGFVLRRTHLKWTNVALAIALALTSLKPGMVLAGVVPHVTAFGAVEAAAVEVLFQFVAVSAYALDGFSHAVEPMVGDAIGRRDRNAIRRAARAALEMPAIGLSPAA